MQTVVWTQTVNWNSQSPRDPSPTGENKGHCQDCRTFHLLHKGIHDNEGLDTPTLSTCKGWSQNHTAMRYEGTSTRVARIQDTDDTKRWRCGAAKTPTHCRWECSLVQPLGKRDGQFLTKKNSSYHTLQWSRSLVFIQTRWRLVHTKTCMRIFIEALSAIVKN